MADLEIEYTGRHPVDFDGVAVGLRVTRNGEYLQFFTGCGAARDLSSRRTIDDHCFWRALVAATMGEIEAAVVRRLSAAARPNARFCPAYVRRDG